MKDKYIEYATKKFKGKALELVLNNNELFYNKEEIKKSKNGKNEQLSEKLVFAKELRSTEKIGEIPNNRPGWYKWWAPYEQLQLILNSPYINDNYLDEILPYVTTKKINEEEYYYIYVGIAVKESLRNRLNWHVNQHHTKTSVESGFLSTLRQTISSLISRNQYDEKTTNDFIDSLVIEYHPINLEIKSEKAKVLIENIEKNEMNNNILPLNIRDNKNDILKKFLKELSRIRKISKS